MLFRGKFLAINKKVGGFRKGRVMKKPSGGSLKKEFQANGGDKKEGSKECYWC